MAGQEEQDDTKTLEPSQRRLDQAREKGDIPRSNDLTAAVGYLGMLIAFAAGGSYLTNRLGDAGVSLIAQAPAWGALMLHGGHGAAPHGALLTEVGLALAPVALVPMGLVLGALVAMRGLAFAPSKLAPKLSRVSPVEVAKQKFGLSGMVEFAKSFAKLVIYSAALGFYLWTRLDDIVLSATLESRPATLLIGRMSLQFLAIVVLIAAVLGVLDLVWQIADHRRKLRMSHKDMRDEMKESDGDPYMKQRRRARGMSIAQNQMLADVPGANVVVVNPEHYAVALDWTPGSARAPVCVAKGVDEVAARIRRAAQEAGVPIRSDPPTARALHATVEIGEEVPPEHYETVAAAIRFADAMRARTRGMAP